MPEDEYQALAKRSQPEQYAQLGCPYKQCQRWVLGVNTRSQGIGVREDVARKSGSK